MSSLQLPLVKRQFIHRQTLVSNMWCSPPKSGSSVNFSKLSFWYQFNTHRISFNFMYRWLLESHILQKTSHLKSPGLQDNMTLVQLSLDFLIIKSWQDPYFMSHLAIMNLKSTTWSIEERHNTNLSTVYNNIKKIYYKMNCSHACYGNNINLHSDWDLKSTNTVHLFHRHPEFAKQKIQFLY